MRKDAQAPKRRQGAAFFPGACTRRLYEAPVRGLYEACTRPVRSLSEKHFYFKMLVTFEPNVAQRSVASQNDHKSKACLPEASNTASTMYRCLKRRLRRLYEAPFLATFFLAPHSSTHESNLPSTDCTPEIHILGGNLKPIPVFKGVVQNKGLGLGQDFPYLLHQYRWRCTSVH